MLIRYYRSYSTFRNMFNSLIIALLISTVLLSVLLTSVYSRLNTSKTNEISTRMLSRLVFITEQVYDEAYSVLLSLGYGENIDINTMMFSTNRDRLREYSGYIRMRLQQTIYPNISYVGIYNGVLDEMMCTVGLQEDTLAQIRQSIRLNASSGGSRVMIPMNNQKIVTKEYDPNLNTLTLIYYSPLSKPGQIGAIFLAIDCKYLSQYISTINENDQQVTFLVDSAGRVLSHPDNKAILQDYSSVDYVRGAIESQQESGYFFTTYRQERTLVTYLRGTGMDWTYITLTPYTDIVKQIYSVYAVSIATSILIVILGALFSLFAAQRTFNPIAMLLAKAGYSPDAKARGKIGDIQYLDDQFSYYVKASSTKEELLLSYALESLLKGELNDETADILKQNHANLCAPYYLVCLLNITRSNDYRDKARQEKKLVLYSLAKIAQQCLAPISAGVHPVTVSTHSVAAIVQLSSGMTPRSMVLALVEAQQVFQEQFKLEFSASVSGICGDLYALEDAYAEALQLHTERFFAKKNSILLKQDRTVVNAEYNHRLENRIWNAIQENDDAQIVEAVGLFIAELRTLSYEYARLYLSQLSINILSFSLSLMPQMEMERFNAFKHNLENLETLDQSHEELLQLCRQIAALHDSRVDEDSHDAVDRAIQLAKENYVDSGFCTNAAAQAVDLSIIYFNRIFKKKVGQSYSTYLNTYRLNMACTLLRTTNLPLNRICGNVGLSNESYFYALFKKEYGITPHQYRSKHAASPQVAGECDAKT